MKCNYHNIELVELACKQCGTIDTFCYKCNFGTGHAHQSIDKTIYPIQAIEKELK